MKIALLYITIGVGLFVLALTITWSLSSSVVEAQTRCYTPAKLVQLFNHARLAS
jgi:hypothetical protein